MCLRRDQSLEGVHEVPSGPLMVGAMSAPGVATMSTSCIVKDEVTGVSYMDTVTTSFWRVTLSGPEQETSAQGPKIQDITDLI